MGAAIVHLHWRPAEFWNATPHEFWAAYEEIERMKPPSQQGGLT
jgi:hypothetical protein